MSIYAYIIARYSIGDGFTSACSSGYGTITNSSKCLSSNGIQATTVVTNTERGTGKIISRVTTYSESITRLLFTRIWPTSKEISNSLPFFYFFGLCLLHLFLYEGCLAGCRAIFPECIGTAPPTSQPSSLPSGQPSSEPSGVPSGQPSSMPSEIGRAHV